MHVDATIQSMSMGSVSGYPPSNSPPWLGPIVLAGVVQALLQGLLFAQAWTYFFPENPPGAARDPMALRAFVGGVFVLGTLQTIERMVHLWRVTVQFQSWFIFASSWTDPVLNTAIAASVQCFLIYRCWKITHRKIWVPLILIGPLLLEISSGVANGIYVTRRDYARIHTTFVTWIFSALGLDTIITTILLFHLSKERTGIEHLDAALRLVMRVTIESAAPCLLCVLLTILMFYTTFMTSNLTMFFLITTGKFYCHALLLTLNSRVALRERMSRHQLGRRSLHGSAFPKSDAGHVEIPEENGPEPDIELGDLSAPRWEATYSLNSAGRQHGVEEETERVSQIL